MMGTLLTGKKRKRFFFFWEEKHKNLSAASPMGWDHLERLSEHDLCSPALLNRAHLAPSSKLSERRFQVLFTEHLQESPRAPLRSLHP